MAKYRYSIGENNSIVDVNDLEQESRDKHAPYKCFGCDRELIPNLGKKKAKHFSHKVLNDCSRETYLHKLAKISFFNEYKYCLENSLPFVFQINQLQVCRLYKDMLGRECETNTVLNYDLTKHFNNIQLEKRFNEFTPDIVITTNDNRPIFIEIAVTHPCEYNKINSGNQIIEINVADELDVLPIFDRKISQFDSRIKIYNFNPKEVVLNNCSSQCQSEVYVFIIFSSSKSRLFSKSPSKASMGEIAGNIIHRELIATSETDFVNDIDIPAYLYRSKVREAYYLKMIPIKNCSICKYHGLSSHGKGIFCKYYKSDVDNSNVAVDCEIFNAFSCISDCLEAEVSNLEFRNRSYTVI